jgi:hypothetical protein
MSTDITPLEDGKLPAYIQKLELDDTTTALAGQSGFKRISIKGGVFRMIEGGQELASSDERSMNIVIVNAAPKTGRSYYEGSYKDGANLSPTCWSSDSVKPDDSVENKQAVACASCPHNVAGSAQGGKGRACRFSHKIAVVLADSLEGDVYAMQVASTSFFGKPVGKYMPLQAYSKWLKAMNMPISAVVTEMRFDKDSPVPKLLFKAVGALKEEQFAISQKQGKTTPALMAVSSKSTSEGGEQSAPEKVTKAQAEVKSDKLNDVLNEFDD